MEENNKTKICVICKKIKYVKSFSSNKSKKDGLKPQCKTCIWFETRNRKNMLNLDKEKDIKLYHKIMEYILEDGIIEIGELCNKLNNSYTIDEMINILWDELLLKSSTNLKLCVLVTCANPICKKEHNINISKYLNNKFYTCDRDCYDKYIQSTIRQDGLKQCLTCKNEKPVEEFTQGRSRCKVCDWIERNSYKIKDTWVNEEYILLIDLLLNKKVELLNNISTLLNKELEDVIDVLTNYIKIGNTPLNIEKRCEECGKTFIVNMAKNDVKKFCSNDCYYKNKKENAPSGKEHHQYNRQTVLCECCGKEIEMKPCEIIRNKHNFCSHECYSKFRSEYYVGEKSSMFGWIPTEEQKRKMRIRTVELYSSGVFDRQTKPQQLVNNILDDNNIEYINEYNCKYYSVDNYLSNENLMIEVMGDYFHVNPLKYKNAINKIQRKDISRDKSKHTYIKKYKEIELLYLWESDINNNLELCEQLILKYIDNKGILEDYNSFNYEYINNRLKLKKYITQPYINYSAKEINVKLNQEI